jgi:hypothetical protein
MSALCVSAVHTVMATDDSAASWPLFGGLTVGVMGLNNVSVAVHLYSRHKNFLHHGMLGAGVSLLECDAACRSVQRRHVYAMRWLPLTPVVVLACVLQGRMARTDTEVGGRTVLLCHAVQPVAVHAVAVQPDVHKHVLCSTVSSN